ncbi:MAG: UPF0721 transmembrane protein [Herpetosiphonaceae bacterium]|nr:MAG: UPF0721 transmembrane protein [Herpetosiphonaceae bacterium]
MLLVMLVVAIGAAIGLSLGMLGGGGSILTVPALVYVLDQDAHAAIATSLVIVGMNASMGAWMHARQGHVQLRTALIFGGAGLVSAYVGARLSRFLPGALLLVLFALLMIVVAALMLRGGRRVTTEQASAAVRWPRVLVGGAGVGFLTGFLGVGGGFLIVPALVLLLGMDMHDAVGTSLVVIALNCAAGLLGHLSSSGLNWSLIGMLVVGGILGIVSGAWLARRMPTSGLRRAFALFVIVLGAGLLAANLPALLVE